MRRRIAYGLGITLLLIISAIAVFWQAGLSGFLGQQLKRNDAFLAEEMAYHLGTLAYLYGYPIVDMLAQMHNETHRVSDSQPAYAPVNRFYRFPGLVTPENSGNLRAPNADTLYYTAWYDVREQPVILSTPDTNDRYYTIAVTNLFSEVTHIGRRTTGTHAQHFALVPEGWQGALPDNVTPYPVSTTRGWLLGRMYVAGKEDLAEAAALVNAVQLTELSDWQMPRAESMPEVQAEPLEPHHDLRFFALLDEALRTLPARPGEAALLDQFRNIGIGGAKPFDIETLTAPTRQGLERAIEAGAKLAETSKRRSVDAYNGWMISKDIGRYGYDYLHRASVVAGGYGNLPEESLYPAVVFDANGELMSGSNRYRITFPPNQLPPSDAFWSLAAYDLWSLRMTENPIARYAIGDRTEGLDYNLDGSLSLLLQHAPPEEGTSNWLPVPSGFFMLVMRLYEPRPEALDHRWVPPVIERLDQ